MKLLEISSLKLNSQIRREHKQLKEILGFHGIELDHLFVYKGSSLLDLLELENGDNLDEKAIYDQFQDNYDWIHIRLSDANWRKLKLNKTLYGQCKVINGTVITYGRWSEWTSYKQAFRFKHELSIYEHVLGMLHEMIHGKEGNMAIAHSYLYGYDKLYNKRAERFQKPKRYVKEPSLTKALDYIFNTSSVVKAITPLLSPTVIDSKTRKYRYFSSGEVVGLNHDFVLLLDEARDLAKIPFVINSGFRTPEHNKKVGGVANSSHLTGLAVDLRARDGEEIYKIVNACMQVGIKRIGINWDKKFVHADVDYSKSNPTIWKY